MLAEWLRERDQRKVEEAREERDRIWQAWYERQQAAFKEGRPFTEPPPIAAKPSTHQ